PRTGDRLRRRTHRGMVGEEAAEVDDAERARRMRQRIRKTQRTTLRKPAEHDATRRFAKDVRQSTDQLVQRRETAAEALGLRRIPTEKPVPRATRRVTPGRRGEGSVRRDDSPVRQKGVTESENGCAHD